ncbi:MAG: hypothetical protein RML36_04925 [Anaerolineae bacterium]|nr:hypothetical protein [Anaerolineae bacterium]MDW8098817.1 hypothetical protein [Anaerolineae bacterium]
MIWLIQPLGPSLVLGAGVLALLLWRLSPWHRWAPLWALVAHLGAWATLIALSSSRAIITVGRPWASVLFDQEGGLIWQVNAWTWMGGFLIALLGLAIALLAWDEGGRSAAYYRAADLSLTAVALMVTFSANLLTLASMWVLMESVALARLILEPAYRSETGRAGLSAASALLMAAACALSGPALLEAPLTSAEFSPLVQGLISTALALRAAVYPLHGWLLHSRLNSAAERFSVYLIPAVTSLWLLGQINGMMGIAWVGEPQWLGLLSVSLFGSAIAAWAEPDRDRSLDLVCANRAGVILLAMSLWPGQGAFPIAGWLLAFSLGMGMLLVAYLVNQAWGGRWPGALAVLTLLGYPATAGFIGQAWTARLAPPTGYVFFWIITVAADALVLAALLRGWQQTSIPLTTRMSAHEMRLLATTVLLAVPVLFVGLQPAIALRLMGMNTLSSGLLPLILHMPSVVWARLLVISAVALWLNYAWEPTIVRWQELRKVVAFVARLDWIYGLAQTGTRGWQAFWQAVLRTIEGEGYLGWVLLTLLLFWILLRP